MPERKAMSSRVARGTRGKRLLSTNCTCLEVNPTISLDKVTELPHLPRVLESQMAQCDQRQNKVVRKVGEVGPKCHPVALVRWARFLAVLGVSRTVDKPGHLIRARNDCDSPFCPQPSHLDLQRDFLEAPPCPLEVAVTF